MGAITIVLNFKFQVHFIWILLCELCFQVVLSTIVTYIGDILPISWYNVSHSPWRYIATKKSRYFRYFEYIAIYSICRDILGIYRDILENIALLKKFAKKLKKIFWIYRDIFNMSRYIGNISGDFGKYRPAKKIYKKFEKKFMG